MASGLPQESSHTVPHWLLLHSSTLPCIDERPVPASLKSPLVHPEEEGHMHLVEIYTIIVVKLPVVDNVHRTPASSLCTQLWLKLARQSISRLSVAVHRTSSITIGPEPAPNLALENGVAPAG